MFLNVIFFFSVLFITFQVQADDPCLTCRPEPSPLKRQTESFREITDKVERPAARPRKVKTISTVTPRSDGLITDRFRNADGCFSNRRKAADDCSPRGWNRLPIVERAQYVYGKYEEILRAHKLPYSPRVLTCKVMRESTFRPQDKAGTSSAAGLSQVTKSTAKDLFNRGKWFKSKVHGFENIRDGNKFYSQMSDSVVAQMELGVAVLHQKSRDSKMDRVKALLAQYYGSDSSKDNSHYAQKIYSCADCIRKNGNVITESCLKRAKD